MATYVNLRDSDYSVDQSQREERVGFFKNIHDFFYKGLIYAEAFLTIIKKPIWKANRVIFSKISDGLGYVGFLLTMFQFGSMRNQNLLTKADILVAVGSFILSTTNVALTFTGGWVVALIESAWGLARQLPFFIGMLLAKNRAREEKLFTLGMKEMVNTIKSGLLSLVVSGGLIGLSMLQPQIGVPLLIALAVPVLVIAIRPFVRKLMLGVVFPAAKTFAKEYLVPAMKQVGNALQTIFAPIKKAAVSLFECFSHLLPKKPQTTNIAEAPLRAQVEREERNTRREKQHGANTHPVVVKLKRQSTTRAASTYSHALKRLSSKVCAFEETVPAPEEMSPDEPFDYFKYVLKNKRPLSALLQDIVLHKRNIILQVDHAQTFSERMQHKKRLDKIHVLELLERFLMQWQEFASSVEPDDKDKKRFVLEEHKGTIFTIQFTTLTDDRDKILKIFTDYLREHYSEAWLSILHRGKVETLVKESVAWIKQPSNETIEARLENYTKRFENTSLPTSVNFLYELLYSTQGLLAGGVPGSVCHVQGLELTYEELIDSGQKEALFEKVERFAVRAYPDFAASYEGRGEKHAIFRAIMNRIYFHETREVNVAELADNVQVIENLPRSPSMLS